MKKISTLAVALITMGSLTMPAWADVVPTETLPSGYYKITSAAYSSAENSKFPWGYMLNDYFLESNTNHATLLAKSFKDNANNYIWKITNDGSTTIAIVNGQGTPIKREDGASGSYKYKEHSTLTPSLSNSDVTTNTYLFSEYLNTPGTADHNHGYGDGAYKAVAYWNKNIGPTTKWKLENLNISDENVYTVSISGGNSSCYVTRAITDGSEVAFNGGFFVSTTTDAISDNRPFTASALEGHKSSITVNSTDKTISVAYTPTKEGLQAVVDEANALLNKRGVGYPLEESHAYKALKTIVESAEKAIEKESTAEYVSAYNLLQAQMITYRATTTDIQMPKDGKVYRIYALWADGTKVYAVNAGKTTSSKYYTSGSKTEPTDNTGLWVVQKVGDYYNIASAKADNLFTYLQGANSGKNQKTAIYSYAGATIGQIKIGDGTSNGTSKCHIVMNVDGSKLDQYTNDNTYNTGSWCSEWVFEEVTDFAGQPVNFAASTDNNNYATLNLPYASKLPEGVTAYKAGEVVDNDLNITEYKNAGEVLPANTPVLLTADAAGEKTFAPAAYVAAEETGFKGTLAATAVTDANVYILSKNGGETVKFFALDETNNTINANKAYLVVPKAGAQALNFNFGNITGIQNAAVEGVNANAPLFDLSGRRVVKAVKGGIYIQNGKKFVK